MEVNRPMREQRGPRCRPRHPHCRWVTPLAVGAPPCKPGTRHPAKGLEANEIGFLAQRWEPQGRGDGAGGERQGKP